MSWALIGASAVLAMIPLGLTLGMGPGIAHVVDRFRSNMDANKQKKALTDWYRHQIAGQLGIPADQVTYRDLDLAAQSNPTFKAMVEKVDRDESQENTASGIATFTQYANPLSWFVPGAGGVTKAVTYIGATMSPMIFAKDKIFVDDVADHIHEKRTAGQALEVGDVFMLRLAHNEALQDDIEKRFGAKFQKMNPEQQQGVMMQMPEMMQAAQREAYAVNQGLISEQDLVVASANAPGQTVAAGMAPRNTNGSFRAREEARRAQAAQMQHQHA